MTTPSDAMMVSALISKIESAVQDGTLSQEELDESVLRIIRLKIKLGLLQPDLSTLPEKISRAQQLFSDTSQRHLEDDVSNDAVTLVQNNQKTLPIKLKSNTRIHILSPWLEQAAGIEREIVRLQKAELLPKNIYITYSKMADTTLESEKLAIDNAE